MSSGRLPVAMECRYATASAIWMCIQAQGIIEHTEGPILRISWAFCASRTTSKSQGTRA